MAKIMIIEDNPVHKVLLSHIMEDLGYEPLGFFDVESARGELKDQMPDFFIIDMQLAESMKGTTAFIKDLHQSRYSRDIPVVIVSAHVPWENIKDGLPWFKPENVIEKPFNIESISRIVKELLNGKK
ncbi:MAG: response regulator [Candidatus Omnitrophota bacterium]